MKRMKIENRARSSYNSLNKSISLLIILLSILMTSAAKSSELSFEEYQRSINPNNFKYLINGKADSEINQFERYSKLFIGGSETVKTRPTSGLATETRKDVKSISSASLDTNKNKTNVLATLKPALHTDKVVTNVKSDSVNSKPFETLHYTGQHEKEMYNEILEKPIVLLGEPTMITSCPHD